MAKKTKTKKSSSKVTKESLLAQNEVIGEQLAGLQEEVMDLVEEVEVLIDENDELEEKNDALQDVIVTAKKNYQELESVSEQQESQLKFADVIIEFAGKATERAFARIAELEQENFHLTIQRDALKDRIKTLELRPVFDVHQVFAESYANAYGLGSAAHSGQHRTASGRSY